MYLWESNDQDYPKEFLDEELRIGRSIDRDFDIFDSNLMPWYCDMFVNKFVLDTVQNIRRDQIIGTKIAFI